MNEQTAEVQTFPVHLTMDEIRHVIHMLTESWEDAQRHYVVLAKLSGARQEMALDEPCLG